MVDAPLFAKTTTFATSSAVLAKLPARDAGWLRQAAATRDAGVHAGQRHMCAAPGPVQHKTLAHHRVMPRNLPASPGLCTSRSPYRWRGPMKRWTIATLTALAVLAGWILTGCSSGSSGSPATTSPAAGTATSASASPVAAATPGTIPDDSSIPMPPGRYGTVHFTPPFTFSTTTTLGGGADTPDAVSTSLKSSGNSNFAAFLFARFAKVCDPNAPSHLTAPPKQLLNCVVHNPHLRVTAKPAPITIGGIPGQQLDVQVVGKLPGPPSCNGDPHPCVRIGTTPAFPPMADGFGIEAGNSARIWIFDVHGTPVAVVWTDLTSHFGSNLAAAAKIMQTVQFS
jgi:hypothetical protein